MAAPLRELADELGIRNPALLYRAAKARHLHASLRLAREVLQEDVGKQVFGPPVRSLGKSAAEGPLSRLQADLVDFRQNADNRDHEHHYILLLVDVFNRQVLAAPLKDKTPETVNVAMKDLLSGVHEDDNFVLTTDSGAEFGKVQQVLPANAVHQEKSPSDRNALAVADRCMQTLKKDLAARIANKGGTWHSQLHATIEAYNARPQEAVHGSPEKMDDDGLQTFKVYQDNAAKFTHNERLYKRRAAEMEKAGAFREAIQEPFHRSFKPTYGPVRQLGSVMGGREFVRDASGRKVLLKHVKPVHSASGEPLGAMTKVHVKKETLRGIAQEIHEWLVRGPQRGEAVNIRFGAQALNKGIQKVTTIMKMFPEMFTESESRWHALVLAKQATAEVQTVSRSSRLAIQFRGEASYQPKTTEAQRLERKKAADEAKATRDANARAKLDRSVAQELAKQQRQLGRMIAQGP